MGRERAKLRPARGLTYGGGPGQRRGGRPDGGSLGIVGAWERLSINVYSGVTWGRKKRGGKVISEKPPVRAKNNGLGRWGKGRMVGHFVQIKAKKTVSGKKRFLVACYATL